MRKQDKSIHNICVASIKRSTTKPYDFKWTRFYETNFDFTHTGLEIDLSENELLICSTIIDSDNYSILTTKKLFTREAGILSIGSLYGASDQGYGDFKGLKRTPTTFGLVRLESQFDLKYFIEAGRASMIMIHGVRTLIRTQTMTDKNIENIARVWNRKNG